MLKGAEDKYSAYDKEEIKIDPASGDIHIKTTKSTPQPIQNLMLEADSGSFSSKNAYLPLKIWVKDAVPLTKKSAILNNPPKFVEPPEKFLIVYQEVLDQEDYEIP